MIVYSSYLLKQIYRISYNKPNKLKTMFVLVFIRFECPDVKKYDKTKCQFKGRSYASGEDLADDIGPECSAACRCGGYSDVASFNCANIECAELFNGVAPGCVMQYKLDACCAFNTVCEKSEKDKLAKCYYREKEYYEGQIIYPENEPCYRCSCTKDFNNQTLASVNQNFKKIDCGIELRNLDSIQKGCVPIYFGDNGCCPIDFRCRKFLISINVTKKKIK